MFSDYLLTARCQRAETTHDCPYSHDWYAGAAYAQDHHPLTGLVREGRPVPTVRDLEVRSLACRTLLHEQRERLNGYPALDSYPYQRRGPVNLELCSSCEYGSHHLCAWRLGRPGELPASLCRCLCTYADVPTYVRRRLDPFRADVLRGERSELDGEWVRVPSDDTPAERDFREGFGDGVGNGRVPQCQENRSGAYYMGFEAGSASVQGEVQ